MVAGTPVHMNLVVRQEKCLKKGKRRLKSYDFIFKHIKGYVYTNVKIKYVKQARRITTNILYSNLGISDFYYLSTALIELFQLTTVAA